MQGNLLAGASFIANTRHEDSNKIPATLARWA